MIIETIRGGFAICEDSITLVLFKVLQDGLLIVHALTLTVPVLGQTLLNKMQKTLKM